jgi:hypothetical protein
MNTEGIDPDPELGSMKLIAILVVMLLIELGGVIYCATFL